MKNNTVHLKCSRLFLQFIFVLGTIIVARAEVVYAFELKSQAFGVGTLLEWGTSFESGSDIFYIEKSNDGLHYNSIGELAAAGHSKKETQYRFLDTEIGKGKKFYRLKLVEKEGIVSYSRTIVLHETLGNTFQIAYMSNTTSTGVFHFTLDMLEEGMMTYLLYSDEGKLLDKNEVLILKGLNDIYLDLSDNPEGTYSVSFQKMNESEGVVVRKIPIADVERIGNVKKKELKKG